MMDLRALFEPKHVAVVGVSLKNERHPANAIFNKNRHRYPVNVYAVNPRGGVIRGEKIYPHISKIPRRIDLAVIAARAEQCPGIFADCIQAGVKSAAVISGGFKESGREDLQKRLVSIAREADFPFIGPNCLGVFSPHQVDTFFLPLERMVTPDYGDIAVVSQSGGILVDMLIKLAAEGLGLSRAVSIGNKALITEKELLAYLAGDPKTRVIAFYLEGFEKNEGREFVQTVNRCRKPVVVLKAGKSPRGNEAVISHTASLAGDYGTFSSALSQYGVVEADDTFELVSFCESLSCYPRSIEGQIGIVSGSGGHAALAVDACSLSGLSVPRFSQDVQQAIQAGLSASVQPIAALSNPVDLTGSAVDDDFIAAVSALSRTPVVDCIMLLLLPYMPGITSDLGSRLSQVCQQEGKPLVVYIPHLERYRMLIEGFELNRIPVAYSVKGVVQMVRAIRKPGIL